MTQAIAGSICGLTKPFGMSELRRLVRRILHGIGMGEFPAPERETRFPEWASPEYCERLEQIEAFQKRVGLIAYRKATDEQAIQ